MQNIGERFEEARKRKGISLREASEATKIRSDFLQHMEQNQLDFELPEIYKRGFVKLYASYLKLDTNSILADYSTQILSHSKKTKRAGGSELFGSMDMSNSSVDANKPSLGTISTTPKTEKTDEETSQDASSDTAFYIKVGMVAVSVIAFLIIIIGLIIAVLNSENDSDVAIADSLASSTGSENPLDESTTSVSSETMSLIASGNVYVLVKQRNDGKKLVVKTLSSGETLEFSKEGPVDVFFTAGENLVIVDPSGKHLRPQGEGTAKILVP